MLEEYIEEQERIGLKTKIRFIDCIWQSRANKDTDSTIRTIIGNRVFNVFDSIYKDKILPIFILRESEEEKLHKLHRLFNNDDDFRKYYIKCENNCKQMYSEYLRKFTGINSFFAWVLMHTDYRDDELNKVKNSILKWYIDERSIYHSSLNGVIFNSFFELKNCLFECFKNISSSLIVSIIVDSSKSLFKNRKNLYNILKEWRSGKIENVIKKIPKNIIFEELYVFDIDEEKIKLFHEITVNNMIGLLDNLPYENKLKMIESLLNGEYIYDYEFDDFEKINKFLILTELDKNEEKYVIDPIKIAFLNERQDF